CTREGFEDDYDYYFNLNRFDVW
nr:immunoglobulin heavy chain junction region [Macaca mulatta]MOV36208.1 immunoglobulin heavy chain junction region [Macaca mulatta]MOV36622.1 immunoglobulin heavy chain junction region [Macaca mulatta]MOV36830.1 immunoglobulin heavy chain junction region [Macaca mulatta]MOV36844.1 immunoglobulin heavy chain junction region [Macaca mulatta]